MSRPKPLILDISEHQLPIMIDYQQLAKSIDLAIIRVQFGSLHEDKHYRQHIENLKNIRCLSTFTHGYVVSVRLIWK